MLCMKDNSLTSKEHAARNVFMTVDRDGDGQISLEETTEFFQYFGLAEATAVEFFQIAGGNDKSSTINLQTFMDAWNECRCAWKSFMKGCMAEFTQQTKWNPSKTSKEVLIRRSSHDESYKDSNSAKCLNSDENQDNGPFAGPGRAESAHASMQPGALVEHWGLHRCGVDKALD